MEAKFTPGPWHVAEHDHGIVVCTDSAKKSKYGASRYAAIGGFDSKDQEQLAEALANAILIAAAPELLACLIAVRDAEVEGLAHIDIEAAIASATRSAS